MRICSAIVILALGMLIGCKKDTGNPVAPATTTPPVVVPAQISLRSYQTTIDTNYVEVWSDSSWSKYGSYKTVNGLTYYVEITSAGNQYYYGAIGYSGWVPSGGSLILFDKPILGWPDSLGLGKQIFDTTTFTYQGYLYQMIETSTLVDTPSISVSFGLFHPCLHFTYAVRLTAGGSSQTTYSDYWCARGPGQIRSMDSNYKVTTMVRGYVNGQFWGTTGPVHLPQSIKTIAKMLDTQWMAKQIIKGIR